MSTQLAGLIFLFLFAASQGIRDAYFGNVFQSTSFLFVALLVFGLACLVFQVISRIRRPGDVQLILSHPRPLFAMNATTSMAWLCYLFGLTYLEPAVVATFHNGIGPLVIVCTSWLGWTQKQTRISIPEGICYAGLALSLVALAIVVVTDNSGMATDNPALQKLALLIVASGGVAVTVSYVFTKWFTDAGAGSDAVMGTRFMLAFVVVAVMCLLSQRAFDGIEYADVPWIALLAFGLMVIPSFFVQLGVSRTTPLMAHVFRSLGPVFVFLVQQLDGRLRFSGGTLICIVAFSFFTIGASLVRGWREVHDG